MKLLFLILLFHELYKEREIFFVVGRINWPKRQGGVAGRKPEGDVIIGAHFDQRTHRVTEMDVVQRAGFFEYDGDFDELRLRSYLTMSSTLSK